MRRRVIALAVGAVVLFSAWLAYSKVAQARRETAYRAAIAPFQRDLSPGMARADVEKYLDSRGVEYHWVYVGGSADSYFVQIGEEPGSLVCKPWKVYLALNFDASDPRAGGGPDSKLDPADKLRDVQVKKMGTCL
ncbi:MAG TPA: hypothetical protein VF532_18350 [Candidatus Angelobacter sp.]